MAVPWTSEEVEYLKDNYLEMTNGELADKLGRTKSSVKTKLNKDLKLIRPSQALTNEDFILKARTLVGEEYTFLEEYVSSKTDIKVVHNKCKHIYFVKPNNFLSGGTRCPRCYGTRIKTQDEFIEEMYLLAGNEYILESEYRGNDKPVDIFHSVCGNRYSVEPRVFTSHGNRCPICRGGLIKSHEDFDREVKSLVGDEYTFLQKYINNVTKLKVMHNKCNYVYSVNPSNFLYGRRCPRCKSSKGEERIYNVLSNNYNFKITPQEKYPNLHYKDSKMSLRSDFKVENLENGVSFFIEYDGRQHFEKVLWSRGMSQIDLEENLRQQQEKDELKNIYCRNNNLKLLRIPYWDFENIERIINNFITKEKII